MKKLLGVLLFSFVLAATAMPAKPKEPSLGLGKYQKMTFEPVDFDTFLAKHPDLTATPRLAKSLADGKKLMDQQLGYYASWWMSHKKPGPDAKELKIYVELTQYEPGSKSLRMFNSGSAGEGLLMFHAKFVDAADGSVLGAYDTEYRVTGDTAWSLAYFDCVQNITKFIDRNKK